ncbi:MAG TPA: OadG family protein [Anaerolineae bacterium]|nr:OadG family protein [Anaerolineae bacterium]HQI85763.1 OadG family protein [Anaerolineae bacterium]
MTTLLNQALILTLIGMGMTFAALGLLVLGMYAMTAFITDKPRRKEAPTEETQTEEALMTQVADVVLHIAAASGLPGADAAPSQLQNEDRQRAAAAAVALALEDSIPQTNDATADCRYRAAAAAVAAALTEHNPAAVIPAPPTIIPDTWNYHARAQHLIQRQRFART